MLQNDVSPSIGVSGLEIFPGKRLREPARAPGEERLLIELAVTWVFGVRHEAIAGATRGKATAALARQVAMYLAHVVCGYSLTRVGEIFERDRTTVAHACMVVEDRRDIASFDRSLDLLELAVRSLLTPRFAFEAAGH